MLVTNPRTARVGPNRTGRDFVVGDVHGCFRTLEQALGQVGFDRERDRLFSVGDLVNRGANRRSFLWRWFRVRYTNPVQVGT